MTRSEMRGRFITTGAVMPIGIIFAKWLFEAPAAEMVDAIVYAWFAIAAVWFFDVRREFPAKLIEEKM